MWGFVGLRKQERQEEYGEENLAQNLSGNPSESIPAEEAQPIVMTIGSLLVKQGDNILEELPVSPQIINGSVMLPLRYLVENILHGRVFYDHENRRIGAGVSGKLLILFIDSSIMQLEGVMYSLDQAPVIVAERILVPLEAIESCVKDMWWDEAAKTVSIFGYTEEVIKALVKASASSIHSLPDIKCALRTYEKTWLLDIEYFAEGYYLGEESHASYAERFLSSLCSGDAWAVTLYLKATNADVCQFIEGIEFEGYHIIKQTVAGNNSQGFLVKLSVAQSSNPIFPEGESFWHLVVAHGEFGCILLFQQGEETDEPVVDIYTRDIGEQFLFCYNFSRAFGIYGSCDNFATALADPLKEDNYLHYAMHYYDSAYYSQDSRFLTGIPISEPNGVIAIQAFLGNLAGLGVVDYSNYRSGNEYSGYDPQSNSVPSYKCAHGGNGAVWSPQSTEYNETTKIHRTVLNYYADQARFIIARTVAYTYQVNEDGTYTMLSTELIYDSGYAVVTG